MGDHHEVKKKAYAHAKLNRNSAACDLGGRFQQAVLYDDATPRSHNAVFLEFLSVYHKIANRAGATLHPAVST